MSAKAMMTVSTPPMSTSCSSAPNDNVGESGSFTATLCGLTAGHASVVNQALPGTGAQYDLGGQLCRRLLHGAPSQMHRAILGIDVLLAGAGDRPIGRRAEQHCRADLDRRAVIVVHDAVAIGDPRMPAVDHHQADEPAQLGRRQFPSEVAAGAV